VKNSLLKELFREMEAAPDRAVSFARFMELALYHPEWGYYMRRGLKLGKTGDFFTNVHVGDLYGRMLARFFLRMLEEVNGEWVLVEMGAGDGRLAEQVAAGLLELGVEPERIRFYLVEMSPQHRELQQERLSDYPVSFRFVRHLHEVPRFPFAVLYSNELVDAFPVHRLKKERGRLLEMAVCRHPSHGQPVECWRPVKAALLDGSLRRVAERLPEGHILEWPQAARTWLKEVAAWMDRGVLVTIDYGACLDELLTRPGGTLRGYREHRIILDVFDSPGETDLTVHVPFDLLIEWGEEEGLRFLTLKTQTEFLLDAGILNELPGGQVVDPFSPEGKRVRAIRQLLHPETMGEVFRVLVQGKGLKPTEHRLFRQNGQLSRKSGMPFSPQI
jgi:SAM-dependent MidA family methyltransferase